LPSQGNGTLDRRLYVQQDANGNVTALVDVTGTVVERYDYDPFGAVTVLNPDFSVHGVSSYGWLYFFQGKRYDGAVGLYDSRERVYSPTLMRPLQMDPLGQAAGVNLYDWEGNGPTVAVDPTGLQGLGGGQSIERMKREALKGFDISYQLGYGDALRGTLGGVPGASEESWAAYWLGYNDRVANRSAVLPSARAEFLEGQLPSGYAAAKKRQAEQAELDALVRGPSTSQKEFSRKITQSVDKATAGRAADVLTGCYYVEDQRRAYREKIRTRQEMTFTMLNGALVS
jgi:RHS repeat-associated protein